MRVFLTSILFILAIFCTENVFTWKINSQLCASIYLEDNYVGQAVKLRNAEQISDFEELYKNNDIPIDNTSSISFHIQPNCLLNLNTRKFLMGESFQFLENASSIPTLEIKSISCICDEICDCNDITKKMKSSECGRAYIDADCSRCSASYSSLKQSENVMLPRKLSNRLKSIVVKDGCAIQLNDQSHFLSSSFTVINETIARYNCKCNEVLEKEEILDSIPSSDLIDMPKTKYMIRSRLMLPQHKNHRGLIAGLESININRSPRNAYILLLGLTGSGKSSTVNLLFDKPLTEVGNSTSTTTTINEIYVPVPIEKLGLANTQLRIVDTPGISDTRGIAKDAQFLATFEEYLMKHEDLAIYKPNVILIVCDFSDNRYEGENSKFVKMLQTIELFRDQIIDEEHTNVIFVFTHFMSEVRSINRNPSSKLESIKKVIKKYSSLPSPILMVVGENKPNAHELLGINGFFLLPNGELYPQNLFAKIQQNLILRGDTIGTSIIQTAFQNMQHIKNIQLKSKKLLPKTHPKITHYLAVLARINTAIESTEISRLLNEIYKEIPSSLKESFPDTLRQLKLYCFRKGLRTIDEKPKTGPLLSKFFSSIQINALSIKLLEGINLTMPNYTGSISVGHGYTLLEVRTLSFPIISDNGMTANVQTGLGYKVPSYIKVQPIKSITKVFNLVNSQDEYVRVRWSDLLNSIPNENMVPNHFNGRLASGYNVLNESKNELNALIEYNLYEMTLDQRQIQLDDTFIETIQALPEYNNTDFYVVQQWNTYFSKFGTHIVEKANFGGSIHLRVKCDPSKCSIPNTNEDNADERAEIFGKLTKAMETIVQYLVEIQTEQDVDIVDTKDVEYEIIFDGGHVENLIITNLSKIEEKSFKEWEYSLKHEPKLLSTYFQLLPISQLIKNLHEGNDSLLLVEKLRNAETSIFDFGLIHLSTISRNRVTTREGTGMSSEDTSAGGSIMALSQFAEIFKQLNDETIQLQNQFMTLMEKNREAMKAKDEAFEIERQRRLEMELKEKESERAHEKYKLDLELQLNQIEEQRKLEIAKIETEFQFQKLKMDKENEIAMRQLEDQKRSILLNFIESENQRISENNRQKSENFRQIAGSITSIGSMLLPLALG